MLNRPRRFNTGMNLDSLVDIVSNIVGILVILAAFMALMTLLNPVRKSQSPVERTPRNMPQKLLVPWSHPTVKNHLFLVLRENRVLFFNLRPFFVDLSKRNLGVRREPITYQANGYSVRFFPVTNQVYCLEFLTAKRFGESWLEAQRPQSAWKRLLREYPPERYVLFFWVATDSFELFRTIRKSLWEQNFEVGWKPAGKDAPLEICNGFEGSNAFRPQ